MGIGSPPVPLVALELEPLVVVIDVERIEVVGVGLVEVADELVESLLPGDSVRADVAQSPFAEAPSRVALFLEQLGHRRVAGQDRDAAGIGAHGRVAHVHPGH